MFKEHVPTGRVINTERASKILTTESRECGCDQELSGWLWALMLGLWEMITIFLPNKGGDFIGKVGFQEIEAKELSIWMKRHLL